MKKLFLSHSFFLISILSLPKDLFSQNVGIGKTDPAYSLHVGAGRVRFEGPDTVGTFAFSLGGYGTVEVDSFGAAGGRFIIRENGKIGIGTSNPQQRLSVKYGMNIDQANANAGSLDSSVLRFGSNSAEAIGSSRNGSSNLYGLDFYTNSLKRMSITSDGKIGVGTITPLEKLDIAGSIRASAYKFSTPKSYYYSINPYSFTASNGNVPVIHNLGAYLETSAIYSNLSAPINFPHGAIITSIEAHIFDVSTTENIYVTLGAYRQDGMAEMRYSLSSSGNSGYQFLQGNGLSLPIENIYSFQITAFTSNNWPGSDIKIRSLLIVYTLSEL